MSSAKPKTSETHPIRVDFVPGEALRLPGRLGMTFAPGKRAIGEEGRWERDLDADLRRLVEHYDADVLVSLLEPEEYDRYDISELSEKAEAHGIKTLRFPIADGGVPREWEADEYSSLVGRIVEAVRQGKTVVVHCRGGLGRTGMIAASVLVALGSPADEAIRVVREARTRTIETSAQEDHVRRFEGKTRRSAPPKGCSQREEMPQVERYRGALLGLAVGDALGAAMEFSSPGSFEPLTDMVGGGPHGLEPGYWTDDTSMALCLAESLIDCRGFDASDQLERYVRWYREGHMSSTGECFDIGITTSEALERFEHTRDPNAGSTHQRSAGNGSIMRLAPVPLFYAKGPLPLLDGTQSVKAIERSGESSRTTHGARAAVDACRYLGGLIAGAVNGASKEELLSERYSPAGSDYWEEHPLVAEVDEVARGSFKEKEPPEIRGTGYVVASLEAALWAFYKSKSFREGCLLAVNLGEDADTTAAVYGQLAGAFYGESGIPKAWRQKLTHHLMIEDLAERLLHLSKTID